MGCSASTLEDEEVVQFCKDRRNFIRQAVEQRNRFAAGHIAYIHALRQVSVALRNYVEGDHEHHHHGFLLDSYSSPHFSPVKRLNPDMISIPIKNFSQAQPVQSEKPTVHVMRYLKPSGNSSFHVEESPPSPETARIDSYYPTDNYGMDGYYAQGSPMYASFFPSPYSRPTYPPPSPQSSQWDLLWNPFSSLDPYGYPMRNSLDRFATSDDEMAGLRRVREEEGIPELEEDEELEDIHEGFIEVDLKHKKSSSIESPSTSSNTTSTTTTDRIEQDPPTVDIKTETQHEAKELMSQGVGSVGVSEPRNVVDVEVSDEKQAARNREAAEATPGFTVYVNRRPTSMTEVMMNIESQFMTICDCAQDISVMLEANRARCSSSPGELAVRIFNPVSLFRSSSSRSTSSRFYLPPSSRDEFSESSSEYSEDSCMDSGSHQSTLDRLYAWEKKLYDEVKTGERIRIAYERKCMQLRSQDLNGDEPSAVDKTRAAIRDLHTRLTVSIHTVEAVSRRIEVLRDEELHAQLVELIQRLARMWRTMAECHASQKRTIDDAKLLFLSTALAAARAAAISFGSTPPKPSRAAAALESALRNWRAALEAWIGAQRSYARALTGWARRCAGQQSQGGHTSPLLASQPSVGSGSGSPPLYGLCMQWAQAVEVASEARVVDGLDFLAAGILSVSTGAAAAASGSGADMETLGPEAMERAAEIAARVVWTGMAATIGGIAEFAAVSAEGYEAVVSSGCAGGSRETQRMALS